VEARGDPNFLFFSKSFSKSLKRSNVTRNLIKNSAKEAFIIHLKPRVKLKNEKEDSTSKKVFPFQKKRKKKSRLGKNVSHTLQ
jgi:hypothetical protein